MAVWCIFGSIGMKSRGVIKIGIAGTRGIPSKYGGFETFVEELSTRLAGTGNALVSVYGDNESWNEEYYKGVKIQLMQVTKSEHPLRYYFLSLWRATKENDIVLVTGSGGALFYCLKFLTNRHVKIIINTDGLEHKRSKWSWIKRTFVLFLENLTVFSSDMIVADSAAIKKYWMNKYPSFLKRKIETIEYGAYLISQGSTSWLNEFGLEPQKYYLVVARLEPENNINLIIEGYLLSKSANPLVIVGGVSPENKYVRRLLENRSAKILFIGGLYNKEQLSSIRFHCKAYLHGHSVGGTNPSLLEAMGSGNLIIAHDNEFNREVTNNNAVYFGSAAECAKSIQETEQLPEVSRELIKTQYRERISEYYNWDNITAKYLDLFNRMLTN